MNRRALYDKCLRREPLSRAEAYALYEACPLQEIASLADRVPRDDLRVGHRRTSHPVGKRGDLLQRAWGRNIGL